MSFVSDDFLSHVKTILQQLSYTRNGMLLINLVCRDDKLRSDVITRVKKVRKCVCQHLWFSLFSFLILCYSCLLLLL